MKSRDIRRTAREALKGNWFRAFIGSAIFAAISSVGSVGISVNVDTTEAQEGVTAMVSTATESAGIDGLGMIILIVSMAFSILMMIVRYAVEIGYSQFNLDIIDGGDVSIGTIFSKFSSAKTAIFAGIMVFIRVALGCICFAIPGIIAAYGCAMTPYIIADNPDMTAREAIRESRTIMKGNRWKLFCLELSFIPHTLLVGITFGIAGIWVVPHMQASKAAFYRAIK